MFPYLSKGRLTKKGLQKIVCGEGREIYKQPKQQFKVQNIDILEEIDSIYWRPNIARIANAVQGTKH